MSLEKLKDVVGGGLCDNQQIGIFRLPVLLR